MKTKVDKFAASKRVNFCVASELNGSSSAVMNGFVVKCLFDSGADCSLIRESVANKVQCTRVSKLNSLKGLGAVHVNSYWETTIHTEFEELALDITYFVLPDECLDYDIIVGRNVFVNTDLVFVTGEKDTNITRKRSCNTIQA